MNRLISVIIITHNRGDYIREAIKSVLSQSFNDWELVVIDDASVDNTREIVEDFMIKDRRIK